ncbi:MAG TPA: PLP-dependent cysteine synthase family protein [Thiolinea sp.]|nr:PLP-dependent cysteine synthase family protein [Thiolinea sp.]
MSATRITPLPDPGWVSTAIRAIEADYQRSADTHLIHLPLAAFPGIDFYFKDESTHPTGSLKHRLARSLFLYGLSNGWIREGSTIIESSSGSTAVSEAYFARLLGLPFIAVMPKSTSRDKIRAIECYGGRCHLVAQAADIYSASQQLAHDTGGHYMDQFTYAERATDWRGNNNIAESIFQQMQREPHPIPHTIVVGAGTGGTSATIGRYIRYACHATRVLVADPEFSVFHAYWLGGDTGLVSERGSRIEGIGRPRAEPSFIRSVIDDMVTVPDCDSIAAMRVLGQLLNRRVGPSTGTSFSALIPLAQQLQQAGQAASLVSLICDSGERYSQTCNAEDWLAAQGLLDAVRQSQARLEQVLKLS